ncbi:MAG: ATPase, T2SS/T4P/T4SS family [Erysipelotrichaceae bacterium]
MSDKIFIKSPIIVLNDDGTVYRFISLHHQPFKNFTVLDIISTDGNVPLGHYEFDGPGIEHVIKIERKWMRITLIYKVKEKNENGTYNEKVIDEQIVNLYERDYAFSYRDIDAEKFEQALELVRKNMDAPGGTEIEREAHDQNLKDSIVNPNAKQYVKERIANIVTSIPNIRNEEIDNYVYNIYANLYGLGIIQELDDDPDVGEIMINGMEFPYFHAEIYYIKKQVKYQYDRKFNSFQEMKNVFNKVIGFSGKEINSSNNAMIEANRPNGDRVNITVPKASNNWSLNIRKFSNFTPDSNSMKKSGTVDDDMEELLKMLVLGHANIGIGGKMGTGKTTFINYLLGFTPKMERKVVIASVSEMDVDRVLKGHDVLIFNVDEELGFTFSQHMRAALRTTADRVCIPESRGGEFKELYEANLKTRGNSFTGHAIDDESFLDMCVDMYNSSPDSGNEPLGALKNKICKAIDIIVIMEHIGKDKIRVKSISEVCIKDNCYSHMNQLYVWVFNPENPDEGHYEATGNKMSQDMVRMLNESGIPISKVHEMNDLLLKNHERFKSKESAKINEEVI